MTPEQYESFRNDLIILLNIALEIDSISDDTRKTLSMICKKTREDQFEIVLSGEFQGGKSTTFNALCDGRELSPRGSGLKTSGCIVSAQNISNKDEPESAIVEWRTSEELISGFSDLLMPHLQNLFPERFGGLSALDLSRILRLDDETDRRVIMRAVSEEWAVWENDKANYDRDQRGKLDILCAAAIAAHHYPSETLKKLRNIKNFKPEEIGKMIIFPSDWTERWKDKNPAKFKTEEVLFTFIRHIRLRIHSENLGRLGCVIVDCPGLSASRWDTVLARRAMFDADAILYLFDGSKTMKLSDLRELRFVRQNQMEDKLFYGCNMFGKSLADSNRILQATVEMLKNNGFHVKSEEVILYHALLALRAIQAERFILKKLDKFTETLMAEGSENNPGKVKKRLNKDIARQIMLLDIDDEFTGIDYSSVQIAKKASGLNCLMGMVEQTVIRKKAKTILIDNGSRRGAECLLEAEGTLRNREKAAFETEKDFWEQVEAADETLQKFDERCKRILAQLDDNSPDAALAQDGWNFINANRYELGNYIAQSLFNEVVMTGFWDTVFRRKKLEDKIDSLVKEAIDAYFETYVMAWIARIKEEKNEIYNERIAKMIIAIDREVREKWQEAATPDLSLLSGITIPNYSGNLEIDSEIFIQHLDKAQLVDNNALTFFIKAGGFIGFVGFAAIITMSVFAVSNPFVAMFAIIMLSSFGGSVTTMMVEKAKQHIMYNKIREKVPSVLDRLFADVELPIKHHLQKFTSDIRVLYKEAFLVAVSRPHTIYEARKKQAEIDFKKSRKERDAIAEHAKRVREDQIQPLRIRFQEFVARVRGCLTI